MEFRCLSRSYWQYLTTVTDAQGKVRQLRVDGLGRTTSLTEDPNGLHYSTSYYYDALNNLTGITQGSQTRTYNYDKLSRLTSATTPESGTTNFTYDADGNVLTRTDARSITTTYSYDALNRWSSKTYSDSTPSASFFYDESSVTLNGTGYTMADGKGRLTHTSAASGLAMSIHSYDSMGRTQDYWQCVAVNCPGTSIWNMHYTYDKAGDVLTWTHPTGYTVTNTVSTAQLITQINSSLADSTHPDILAEIGYSPFGAPTTIADNCSNGNQCAS